MVLHFGPFYDISHDSGFGMLIDVFSPADSYDVCGFLPD